MLFCMWLAAFACYSLLIPHQMWRGFSFPDLNQAGFLYLVLGGGAFLAFLLSFPVAAELYLVSVVGLG